MNALHRNTDCFHTKAMGRVYRSGEVELHALREIDLQVGWGEFLAILGASGSGKSTLMNLLGCLDRPSSGVCLLDGIDVSRLCGRELAAIRNARLGFVFQSFHLLSRASALENVELPLFYCDPPVNGRERRRRAREALARVGLGTRISHYPSQLSGGQKQRIAIARALVAGPRIVLADEPTGNLDTHTSLEIMELFQELNASGITLLMVTHELDIAAYAKRFLVLRDGRLISDRPNPSPRDAHKDMAAFHTRQDCAGLE
jgi:putative ABC transport system ATP-binding protein